MATSQNPKTSRRRIPIGDRSRDDEQPAPHSPAAPDSEHTPGHPNARGTLGRQVPAAVADQWPSQRAGDVSDGLPAIHPDRPRHRRRWIPAVAVLVVLVVMVLAVMVVMVLVLAVMVRMADFSIKFARGVHEICVIRGGRRMSRQPAISEVGNGGPSY